MTTVNDIRTGRRTVVPLLGAGLLAIAAVSLVSGAIASSGQRDAPAKLSAVDELSGAFERVAESVQTSVVSIRSTKAIHPTGMRSPLQNSPLREFFGDDLFGRFSFPQIPDSGIVQQGQGSGFVVSDDGYILTNNHVVDGADDLRVVLSDDSSYEATVVGTDPHTDLAVIKIDADHLKPLELGNSNELRVGEWVVAAGNPFGLSSTITSGIVSAKGRSRMGITDYEDFIQTDAAINPGNSGGPLVDLHGRVVGVNTAIASRSGGNMGIGFAIPIDMAKSVMQDLMRDGKVVRGWVGVSMQGLTPKLARSFGYDDGGGALVGTVLEDSPASKAGLAAGDIITKFDGRKVTDINAFRMQVAQTAPGTETEIVVFRGGRAKTLDITIGELHPSRMTASAGIDAEPTWGMTVRALSPDLLERLGLDRDTEGVVITSVEPLSAAAEAGLRPRDVITEIQGRPVRDVQQFHRIMQEADLKKGVRFGVRSADGMQRFVYFQMDD